MNRYNLKRKLSYLCNHLKQCNIVPQHIAAQNQQITQNAAKVEISIDINNKTNTIKQEITPKQLSEALFFWETHDHRCQIQIYIVHQGTKS